MGISRTGLTHVMSKIDQSSGDIKDIASFIAYKFPKQQHWIHQWAFQMRHILVWIKPQPQKRKVRSEHWPKISQKEARTVTKWLYASFALSKQASRRTVQRCIPSIKWWRKACRKCEAFTFTWTLPEPPKPWPLVELSVPTFCWRMKSWIQLSIRIRRPAKESKRSCKNFHNTRLEIRRKIHGITEYVSNYKN